MNDFQKLLDAWNVKHFTANEFFYKGGSNDYLHLNTDPPVALWPNMEHTAKTLETARIRFDQPLTLTSVYRSPGYNKRVGGVSNSQHVKFNAVDIATPSPAKLYILLMEMRRDGLFKGGLGLYRTFVHMDTRGYNATWRG